MATTYIKCCGKLHEVIQFTTKGPIQYGAECSVCGKRVAGETPKDVGWKWEKMKASKPLNAGLPNRLRRIFWTSPSGRNGWKNVADEVRKLVKEAKEGE